MPMSCGAKSCPLMQICQGGANPIGLRTLRLLPQATQGPCLHFGQNRLSSVFSIAFQPLHCSVDLSGSAPAAFVFVLPRLVPFRVVVLCGLLVVGFVCFVSCFCSVSFRLVRRLPLKGSVQGPHNEAIVICCASAASHFHMIPL